jgi:hypothetical protein
VANVLGLIFFALYCAVIISVAAGITWIVVRYSPSSKKS